MDTLSVSLSGLRAAETRLAASAHDVANLQTPDARPLRVDLATRAGGGVRARGSAGAPGAGIDLAGERVEQMLAGLQLRASHRVADTALELRGHLLDVLA